MQFFLLPVYISHGETNCLKKRKKDFLSSFPKTDVTGQLADVDILADYFGCDKAVMFCRDGDQYFTNSIMILLEHSTQLPEGGVKIMNEYYGMNLMSKMWRLDLFDDIPRIVDKMAENNIGTMEFVMIILQSNNMTKLVACDNLGLYGKNLYMFWNDCCQRDLIKVCAILERYMANRISKDYILKHLNEFRGENINMESEE